MYRDQCDEKGQILDLLHFFEAISQNSLGSYAPENIF